ncbi:hypothetical protein HYV81_03060 [Candidatus Woesearchaeota archaeon]|nr:hypothetical protein [Candidatus Woesearchaeota archaeon]
MNTPYIPHFSRPSGIGGIAPGYSCYLPNPLKHQADFPTRDALIDFLRTDLDMPDNLAIRVIGEAEKSSTGISDLSAGPSTPYHLRIESQDIVGFRVVVTQANLGGYAFVHGLKEKHRQEELFTEV